MKLEEKHCSTTKYIHLQNRQMLGLIQCQSLSPAENSLQSIFAASAPMGFRDAVEMSRLVAGTFSVGQVIPDLNNWTSFC